MFPHPIANTPRTLDFGHSTFDLPSRTWVSQNQKRAVSAAAHVL